MPNQEAGLENLEPAVRVEAILDGQDVAPATRLEYFLKKAAESGGGSSVQYVNISAETPSRYIADKTFAEVQAAYNAGDLIVFIDRVNYHGACIAMFAGETPFSQSYFFGGGSYITHLNLNPYVGVFSVSFLSDGTIIYRDAEDIQTAAFYVYFTENDNNVAADALFTDIMDALNAGKVIIFVDHVGNHGCAVAEYLDSNNIFKASAGYYTANLTSPVGAWSVTLDDADTAVYLAADRQTS